MQVRLMCFIHRMHLQIIFVYGKDSCLTFACETEKEVYHYISQMRENSNGNEEAYRCYKINFLGF